MNPFMDLWHGIRAAFGDKQVLAMFTLTCSLIACATIFYRWAEGWNLIDAAYFSVITISTVGYGDFAPQTVLGKLFTMGYTLVGLGMFVATASSVADAIITARRNRESRQDRS